MATKYVKTKAAVAAYDRAWERAERATTSSAAEKALERVERAERKVRECWVEESQLYADARTAANVRQIGMPRCPADWKFLREVVLEIRA